MNLNYFHVMINNIIKIQRWWKNLLKNKDWIDKIISYKYNKYLKKLGVKLLGQNSKLYMALKYLYINRKKDVSIDDLRIFCINNKIIFKNSSDSLQVRHLGLQYGFNILKCEEINSFTNTKIKKGFYCLINLKNCHPSFIKDKRKIEINNLEWNIIKKEYEYKCATCGNEENKTCRYNKNTYCILQQGHINPTKKLTLDNIIPQCQYCNQQYKNKFIFNKRGMIIKQIN